MVTVAVRSIPGVCKVEAQHDAGVCWITAEDEPRAQKAVVYLRPTNAQNIIKVLQEWLLDVSGHRAAMRKET